jgi:Arc/MetJ-type ribon-helix-helix transcriptional regulator
MNTVQIEDLVESGELTSADEFLDLVRSLQDEIAELKAQLKKAQEDYACLALSNK